MPKSLSVARVRSEPDAFDQEFQAARDALAEATASLQATAARCLVARAIPPREFTHIQRAIKQSGAAAQATRERMAEASAREQIVRGDDSWRETLYQELLTRTVRCWELNSELESRIVATVSQNTPVPLEEQAQSDAAVAASVQKHALAAHFGASQTQDRAGGPGVEHHPSGARDVVAITATVPDAGAGSAWALSPGQTRTPTGGVPQQNSKADRDAHFRAIMIAPLLNKQNHPDTGKPFTAETLAKYWRETFSGERNGLDLLLAALLGPEAIASGKFPGATGLMLMPSTRAISDAGSGFASGLLRSLVGDDYTDAVDDGRDSHSIGDDVGGAGRAVGTTASSVVAEGEHLERKAQKRKKRLAPRVVRGWGKIAGFTLSRWVKAVRKAQEEDRHASRPLRAPFEILRHHYPEERKSAASNQHRVRRALVAEYYDDNHRIERGGQPLGWSAARIAFEIGQRHGLTVSARTVQRDIEDLGVQQRVYMRGGPNALMEAAALYPYREAQWPNDIWIIDNSYLRWDSLSDAQRAELVEDPDYYRSDDEISAFFDFNFAFKLEHVSKFGDSKYERCERPCITLVVDACTRRHLATRLWPSAPTAHRMLLTLYEAMKEFGRPKTIYSDNGSEFKNAKLADALMRAGVGQVHSKPYVPRGRGKVERPFRTIKGMLGGMPGYYGIGGSSRLPFAQLKTLEENEARLKQSVDTLINSRRHTTTDRVPAEHYDTLRRQRAFDDSAWQADPHRMLALLQTKWARRQEYGIEVNGHVYIGDALLSTMDGQDVFVWYDEIRWREITIGVQRRNGDIEPLGTLSAYNRRNPPPEAVSLLRALHEVIATNARTFQELGKQRRSDALRATANMLGVEATPVSPSLTLSPGPQSDESEALMSASETLVSVVRSEVAPSGADASGGVALVPTFDVPVQHRSEAAPVRPATNTARKPGRPASSRRATNGRVVHDDPYD